MSDSTMRCCVLLNFQPFENVEFFADRVLFSKSRDRDFPKVGFIFEFRDDDQASVFAHLVSSENGICARKLRSGCVQVFVPSSLVLSFIIYDVMIDQ